MKRVSTSGVLPAGASQMIVTGLVGNPCAWAAPAAASAQPSTQARAIMDRTRNRLMSSSLQRRVILARIRACRDGPARRAGAAKWAQTSGGAAPVSGALAGSRGVDRERMDAGGELMRERLVDHAVAVDPALSAEGLRHNIDAVVGLSARPVACVALVLVRFIDHPQVHRGERGGQLLRDGVGCAHAAA